MSTVDQFESVFRAAVKDVFVYAPVGLHNILVVTDLPADAMATFTDQVKGFLQAAIGAGATANWTSVAGDQYATTDELLTLVAAQPYDLICTYRNLHSRAWQFPHSLGAQLDVLLQKTQTPVLVLPHPEAGYAYEHALTDSKHVMAVTDHLLSDHRLVNYAVHVTEQKGQLFLAHIEDERTFERYMDAVSKIPNVDTDSMRVALREQLLKMPTDYIASCQRVLAEVRADLQIHAVVQFGHLLAQYQDFIEQKGIDLLVMHAKDDDQMAMHGLAYPLAVEIRQIPLLML